MSYYIAQPYSDNLQAIADLATNAYGLQLLTLADGPSTCQYIGALTIDQAYMLPAATTTTLGGVLVGDNLTVNNGTISVPSATTTTPGVVVAGDNLTVNNGTISVPSATTTTPGVVQVGDNLTVNNGTISVPSATTTTLGGVLVGDNLTVNNGTISVPSATTTTPGVVVAGDNLTVNNGVLSVPSATTTTPGVVQVGDNLTVNNGVLSANIQTSAWANISNKPTTVSGYGITDALTATPTSFTVNPAGSSLANWPSLNSVASIQRNSLINGSYYTAGIQAQSYDSSYNNGSISLLFTSNSTGTLKIGGLKVYKNASGLVYADLLGGPSFGGYNETISANAGSASTLITRGYGDSRYRGYFSTFSPDSPADLANVPYPAQVSTTLNLRMADQRYVLKSSSPRPV